MNLRKQIFISFLIVAVAPLLLVMVYLFRSNTKLASDLYRQNLRNATAIQTDIIDENINRTLLRARAFAAGLEKSGALSPGTGAVLKNRAAADEILQFTEDTLDSIQVFTLLDRDGGVLYSSGSNSDTAQVEAGAAGLPDQDGQFVSEITMGDETCCIAIVTPVGSDGRLIAVYRNAFFLKTISSHTQIERSNAFFYCRAHHRIVAAKRNISAESETFGAKLGPEDAGAVSCNLEGEPAEACFQQIDKTPWVLANDIPVRTIHAHVLRYLAINLLVFAGCLAAVVLLSRLQGRRILQPMEWLLQAVERFFLSGEADFENASVGNRTEVGYLAEKFAGLAAETAAAQANLRESNFLYESILHACYEACLTIDYKEDRVEATMKDLELPQDPALSAPQRVFDYYRRCRLEDAAWNQALLEDMIFGRLTEPAEEDVGVRTPGGHERWYQILAVPILDPDGSLRKTVFHMRNITGQKQEELKLLRSSQRDALCGLLNKAALIELAGKRNQADFERAAMFFADLDNFKQANDLLGHLAGDEVLLEAAGVLRSVFRSSDLVCRYGGDEFVVLAFGISPEVAERRAAQLVERLNIRRGDGDSEVLISASVGVWLSDGSESVEDMIHRADEAMYRAKQSGKARYCICRPSQVHTEPSASNSISL